MALIHPLLDFMYRKIRSQLYIAGYYVCRCDRATITAIRNIIPSFYLQPDHRICGKKWTSGRVNYLDFRLEECRWERMYDYCIFLPLAKLNTLSTAQNLFAHYRKNIHCLELSKGFIRIQARKHHIYSLERIITCKLTAGNKIDFASSL